MSDTDLQKPAGVEAERQGGNPPAAVLRAVRAELRAAKHQVKVQSDSVRHLRALLAQSEQKVSQQASMIADLQKANSDLKFNSFLNVPKDGKMGILLGIDPVRRSES